MTIQLKKGAQLAVGISGQPVDLVIKSTGSRIPLSSDEAAIAMILIDGAPEGDPLLGLVRQHGVAWDRPTLSEFIDRLKDEQALELLPPPLPPPPPPPTGAAAPLAAALDDGEEMDEDEEETYLYDSMGDGDGDTVVDDGFHSVVDAAARRHEPLEQASRDASPQRHEPLEQASRDASPLRPLPPDPVATPAAAPVPTDSPAGRERSGAPEDPLLRPLAVAAVMVRDKDLEGARRVLKAILEQEPNNLQAMAMLELIAGSDRRAGARRGRAWIPALLIMILLGGAAAAGLLIKVPQVVTLPCKASRVDLAPVTSSMIGQVEKVHAARGEVIQKGALVLEVSNPAVAEALSRARGLLDSEVELLKIMKSGGSDAAERKQKKRLRALGGQLKTLGACQGKGDCAARSSRLRQQIAEAKKKLRFCEWQALPKEVAVVQEKIDALTRKLGALKKTPTSARVISPTAGLVTFIISSGTRTSKGTPLLRMVDPEKIEVHAAAKGSLSIPGGQADVTLSGARTSQMLKGNIAGRQVDGSLKIVMSADVRNVQVEGSCKVMIPTGEISYASYLWRRLSD